MPPRWPRKPDRNDPDYRRLDDRMNFAMHVALFAVVNSGLWFLEFWETHQIWEFPEDRPGHPGLQRLGREFCLPMPFSFLQSLSMRNWGPDL